MMVEEKQQQQQQQQLSKGGDHESNPRPNDVRNLEYVLK